MRRELIAALRGTPIDASIKGYRFEADEAKTIDEIVALGLNVLNADLEFPILILKQSALDHNLDLMQSYCANNGVLIAPHGKTTMAPQLFERQIEHGAWGITAANSSQVRAMRHFGVPNVLLANVLVDRPAIEWVASQIDADPEFGFVCYVDDVKGVEIMEDVLSDMGSQVSVLVELGYVGGRTGSRSVEDALSLAKRVSESRSLRLAGIAGFEGLIPGGDQDAVVRRCRAFLGDMRALLVEIEAQALIRTGTPIVSAGGSSYFDLVVEELGPKAFDFPVTTILRSGCYVTHDAEMYESTSALAARASDSRYENQLHEAIELWATVWSRPERGLAVLGFGKRDAPYDYRLPIAKRVVSGQGSRSVEGLFQVTALNDQHAFVQVPEDDPLEVGDHVMFGVSHPCGAFDKWRVINVVDDDYNVVDAIFTVF